MASFGGFGMASFGGGDWWLRIVTNGDEWWGRMASGPFNPRPKKRVRDEHVSGQDDDLCLLHLSSFLPKLRSLNRLIIAP